MRPLTPVERKLQKERTTTPDVALAFLSKPKILVLKNNWVDLIEGRVPNIRNCPDFQLLLEVAKRQYNVISVAHTSLGIVETRTSVLIPDICFRKDMLTTPLMKGE